MRSLLTGAADRRLKLAGRWLWAQVAELEGGAWRCIATSVQELEAVGTQLTTSRRAADLEVASAVRLLV